MKKQKHQDDVYLASRLFLAAFAGAISYFAFPRPGFWPAIFVSVALFFVAVRGATLIRAWLVGFVGGFTFFASQCWWLSQYLGPLPLVALSLLQALFVAFGMLAFEAGRRRIKSQLIQAIFFASVWTGREWVSTHWPYGGFPWSRLSMSQAYSPLAGWVYFGGLSLLSFVVAAVSTIAVICLPKIVTASSRAAAFRLTATTLMVAFLVPILVPPSQGQGEKFRVVGIQGNANAGLFANTVPGEILANHLAVTEKFVNSKIGGAKLVVWPENASDLNPLDNQPIATRIDRLVNEKLGVPLVFGTLTNSNGNAYNSSLLWKPSVGLADQYDKKRPVPFAEYVPDRDFWFQLAPDLIGLIYRGFAFGTRDPIFEVDGKRFGVLICFEIAVDEISQGIVDGGATAIISQTNNADFGHSDESYQQIAIAKLRAIETGLPLINVSTTGPSGAFTGSGKTLALVPAFEPRFFVVDLPLRKSDTPAMSLGRYFDIVNIVAAMVLILTLEVHRRRRKP